MRPQPSPSTLLSSSLLFLPSLSFPRSQRLSNSPSITRATESREQMLSVQPPCPIALCASPLLPLSLPRSSSSRPSRGSICSPPREANVCFLLLPPVLHSLISVLFFFWLPHHIGHGVFVCVCGGCLTGIRPQGIRGEKVTAVALDAQAKTQILTSINIHKYLKTHTCTQVWCFQ